MSETNGNETPSGHDANGRFAPGNKKAKGRPPRDGKRYQAILAMELTPEKYRAMVARIWREAVYGDPKTAHHAWNWIGKFSGAEPKKTLELLHSTDGAEKRSLIDRVGSDEEGRRLITGLAAKLYGPPVQIPSSPPANGNGNGTAH